MSDPYAAPTADISSPDLEGEYNPELFSTQGRIGRLRYFAWGFLLNLIAYIPLMLLGIVAPNLLVGGGLSIIIVGVFFIALLVVSFFVTRRRLWDLDQSPWFFLLLLVPLVNIFFSLYLFLWPGTQGSNKYGLQPAKNGLTPWLILGIVFVVMLGIIAAVGIPAYQEYVETAKAAAR